jgi:hypothetical protein
MIEMKVAGIALDALNRSPIVLLKTRQIDVRYRFTSITIKQKQLSPRWRTRDLPGL